MDTLATYESLSLPIGALLFFSWVELSYGGGLPVRQSSASALSASNAEGVREFPSSRSACARFFSACARYSANVRFAFLSVPTPALKVENRQGMNLFKTGHPWPNQIRPKQPGNAEPRPNSVVSYLSTDGTDSD